MTTALSSRPMSEQAQVPDSPAWWLNYLCNKFVARDRTYDLQQDARWQYAPFVYRTRRERLNLLWSYYIGQPPLPQIASHYTDTFRDVLRKGRATYAPMAITPMLDRMDLTGVRTGVTDGPEGDDVAKKIMEYSNFAAALKDAFTYLFVMSEAYLMVIPATPDSLDQTPLITAEDPRTCIGEPDPMNPNQLLAALKIGYDPVESKAIAWLFHDGMQYKASVSSGPLFSQLTFGASSFEWDGPPVALPQLNGVGSVPVVQLVNARAMGEFEPHLDLLDRINDTILQRLVLTAYQSFKQRAVIGDLEEGLTDDEATADPEEIDWNAVFSADPGALWRVPAGTTFWESGPADMTGIITAIRDDVKEFAAVTSTPLHLITPDAANQSAEGAALMREGLVFKVKDRRARLNPRLVQLWRMAFAFAGETERSKTIELLWGPVEAFSLIERAQAINLTRGVLSRYRQSTMVLEMTPEETQENMQELQQDQILDAALTVAPPPSVVRMTENITSKAPGSSSNTTSSSTPGAPGPQATPNIP